MKYLDIIENAFSAILFLLGIIISLYSVFMRYVVEESVTWAPEIYTMMLVWAIFIGFSTALRDDHHIAIDILYDRFGPKMRKFSQVLTLIIGVFFSIFIIWTGMEMVLIAHAQGIVTIDVGFPLWINYLIMPIAGALLLIRFLHKAYKFFLEKENIDMEGDAEWKH